MTETSIYRQLGIDPKKASVREIFGKIVDNDTPHAFVNMKRDPDFPELFFTKHPDGDGSKFLQRLLHVEETGEIEAIQGAVDDAFEMNFGDIAASGFVSGKVVITQILEFNGAYVEKEAIMRQIAIRVAELLDFYRKNGFDLTYFMGGETADLPNQTSSVIYCADFYARTLESNIITGENIAPGDKIYGFASYGQAAWEPQYNFGLMSNGATQGRQYLMSEEYNRKYPYLVGYGKPFKGRFKVADPFPDAPEFTMSQALLSPTRNWSLIIKKIIDKLKQRGIFDQLHGISMNTGGGATKIAHVGQGITYRKRMPEPPPLFQLIKEESKENWKHMFESFNCGVGIDAVGEDTLDFSLALEEVAEEIQIELFDLGRCEGNRGQENEVILETPYGTFDNY
ncbi:MAG: hypothetical protein U5L10_01120 [Candidatus Moranbacteria bacterium]|nr:hypothetical protein [Candidatus Moranbacteria bacterium]